MDCGLVGSAVPVPGSPVVEALLPEVCLVGSTVSVAGSPVIAVSSLEVAPGIQRNC